MQSLFMTPSMHITQLVNQALTLLLLVMPFMTTHLVVLVAVQQIWLVHLALKVPHHILNKIVCSGTKKQAESLLIRIVQGHRSSSDGGQAMVDGQPHVGR